MESLDPFWCCGFSFRILVWWVNYFSQQHPSWVFMWTSWFTVFTWCMPVHKLKRWVKSLKLCGLPRIRWLELPSLGFCVQYCFLVLGFLTFPKGYGFADMDTSQCSSLMECLLAHLDYGFRSGPVWKSAQLSWWKFAFDYLYNLVVILILAAIISGIIIDTFANMRADLQEKNDDQQNNCFICGINRSTMERQMVKFEHHVFQEHYMWSYARFLMYLKQSKDSELNGPESYVKDKVLRQDYSFFPINRALSLDSDDEDYSERQVRIKDLEDMRGVVRSCSETSQHVLQLKREVKQVLKESNEAVSDMQKRLHLLSGDVAKKVARCNATESSARSTKREMNLGCDRSTTWTWSTWEQRQNLMEKVRNLTTWSKTIKSDNQQTSWLSGWSWWSTLKSVAQCERQHWARISNLWHFLHDGGREPRDVPWKSKVWSKHVTSSSVFQVLSL